MADRRPPAPKLPTTCKPLIAQAAPPAFTAQQEQGAIQNVDQVQQGPPPIPPAQVPDLVQPPAPPAQVPNKVQPQLETNNFPEVAKVQRFCLTLTREARLWYESLRPIVIDRTGIQEQFRQQYSKFDNTQEQLFHVWRSFHYDKNA